MNKCSVFFHVYGEDAQFQTTFLTNAHTLILRFPQIFTILGILQKQTISYYIFYEWPQFHIPQSPPIRIDSFRVFGKGAKINLNIWHEIIFFDSFSRDPIQNVDCVYPKTNQEHNILSSLTKNCFLIF